MRVYILDRRGPQMHVYIEPLNGSIDALWRGPKDSENTLNSFLSKNKENVFRQIGTDMLKWSKWERHHNFIFLLLLLLPFLSSLKKLRRACRAYLLIHILLHHHHIKNLKKRDLDSGGHQPDIWFIIHCQSATAAVEDRFCTLTSHNFAPFSHRQD